MRGFRDEAPRVVIDEPKTDRDVPAEATVPVRVIARRRLRPPLGADDLPGRHRRFRAARGGRHSALDGPGTRTRPGAAVVRQAPGDRARLAARAAQAAGRDRHHVLCRRTRLRHDQGTERRQEPRDPPADRLQGRRGPPVRRRPPRAARRAGPRPHHAEAGDHAGRERDPHPDADRPAPAERSATT